MAEKKYIIDNAELMAEWNWGKNNELKLDHLGQIIYVSLNPCSLRASQVVLVVKNLPVNAVDI